MAHVFSRLLLATEHSDFDSGAEALAFALARRCGLALNGVLPLVSNPEFETVAPRLAAKAEAEASVRRQQLSVRAQSEGVSFDLKVRRGHEPYAEIIEEARRTGTDLIVIRRRGKRGWLANLLVGEMVSKVVAHAPCSVLIAPRGAKMWRSSVMVGIDPDAPDAALLAQAAAMAAECGVPLRVLCVAAHDLELAAAGRALSEALTQARRYCSHVEGEICVGRPHHELIRAAESSGADLLVVARHGADNLARAWIGGTTQKVIGLAECPVLVHVNRTATT